MGSFGDRLKKEREQRKISLDDISLSTKIGTRLLRALEEEKFDQLPGGIFNKGFVRAYARHVGLDEDQTVADYMTAVGADQVAPAQEGFPVQVPQERPSEPSSAGRVHVVRETRREPAAEIPWGLLAILLLLVALTFAGWSYYHREPRVEQKKSSPTSSGSTTAPAPPAAAPSTPTGSPVTVGSPSASTPYGAPAVRPPGQSAPVEQAALSQAMPTQGGAPATGVFSVTLKGNEESEECWVSIVVDGKAPEEAILSAPTQKVVQGNREIVVRAGNVGALDVFFNGKKLPSQGEYGVVKTLVFHFDGLQPPAPKVNLPTR